MSKCLNDIRMVNHVTYFKLSNKLIHHIILLNCRLENLFESTDEVCLLVSAFINLAKSSLPDAASQLEIWYFELLFFTCYKKFLKLANILETLKILHIEIDRLLDWYFIQNIHINVNYFFCLSLLLFITVIAVLYEIKWTLFIHIRIVLRSMNLV